MSSDHSPADRRPAGFTLIEILVALAILGIALGALMPQFSLGGIASERAERTEGAVLLAERLLTEADDVIPLPVEGDVAGRTEDGYSWTLSVCCARTVVAPGSPGRSLGQQPGQPVIRDYRATVSWTAMRGVQNVSLVTRKLTGAAQP